MNAESCAQNEIRRPSPAALAEKVAYAILYNRVVEAALVSVIGLVFVGAAVIDGFFHTRLERQFIGRLRDVSRDRLNPLRKAQIRFVFRCQYGLRKIRIRLAGGSYWLSIPCIVEGRKNGQKAKYLAKIINARSALKHRYMTMLRNLGGIVEASDVRFDEYADAKDMVDFEHHCLSRLRRAGLDAPAVIGVNRLNEDDIMLVLEFIEGEPLSKVPIGPAEIDGLLGIVWKMHAHGVVHGDIKLDNLLLSDGRIFVLDCLKIGSIARPVAQAFDVISALCALCQKTPVETVIGRARGYFSREELLRAGSMLELAAQRVDIDLPHRTVMEIRDAIAQIAGP